VNRRPGPGLATRLGDRLLRRAEPRFGIGLGAVGMLMIVVGVLAWGGEATGDTSEDDPNRVVGMLLSLLVIAAGYGLLVRFRRGPLASSGVVAAALGVPLLLGFATFDPDSTADSDALFALPFAVDVIVLISLAAWLATYVWVPFARGRALFLALSAFTLWLYVLEKVEEGASVYVVSLPYSPLFLSFGDAFDSETELPDPAALGGPSLLIGVAYYVLAIVADRQGWRGLATPLLAAGFLATAIGIGHLAGDLDTTGTGVLLVAVGTVLGLYGAVSGRRFTAWVWAAGIGLGFLLIVSEVFRDGPTEFGVAAILMGVAVIVLGHLVSEGFSEPDEMTPGPSRFRSRRTGVPTAPLEPGGPGGPGGPWGPAGPWGPGGTRGPGPGGPTGQPGPAGPWGTGGPATPVPAPAPVAPAPAPAGPWGPPGAPVASPAPPSGPPLASPPQHPPPPPA
jgi:hypothetical protein